MPPEPAPIPLPKGRGRDVIDWLDAHGYTARVPLIRSGDYAEIGMCPFHYYLSHRLSLSAAIGDSEALTHGSWFHKRLELSHLDAADQSRQFAAAVARRIDELDGYCTNFGIIGEARARILNDEREHAQTAWTWYTAAADVKVRTPGQPDGGPLAHGFEAWLHRPQHRILGRELFAIYRHPRFPRTALAARFDILLLHVPQNTLWIVDAKTTGDSTINRAQSCPMEMQAHHYLFILKALLEDGTLAERFPEINADTRVGGIRHWIVQKPTIRLSGQDRPFTLDTSPFKSGPRKGQPRNEKVFSGDPSFDNYLRRVRDWYLGTGDYLDRAPDILADPPVNLSTTSAVILDDWLLDEYTEKLDTVYRFATRDPIPSNFPRTSSGMMDQYTGKPGPFAPLYVAHPAEWPELIRTHHLIQNPRDPAFGHDSPTGLYT